MKNFYALFLLLASSYAYSNCMLYEVSLNDRVNNSEIVVEGEIISSYAEYINDNIYTIHEFEIYTVFKGNPTSAVIKVATPGGIIGNQMFVLTPSLTLNVGNVGVLFLKNDPIKESVYEPYAGPQGFIYYDLINDRANDPFNTFTGITGTLYSEITNITGKNSKSIKKIKVQEVYNNKASAGPITDITPKFISGGTRSILTIKGSNFGVSRGTGNVEFVNASSGPTSINPLSSEYVSWKDTEIKVYVPSGAGTGKVKVNKNGTSTSTSELKVEYAQLNVNTSNGFAFQVAHVNDNTQGGYDWRMNNSFNANTNANKSFVRAMQNWIDATCINWQMSSSTAVDKTTLDGTNIIRFGGPGEVSNGVLATTGSYYSSCNSGLIWFVDEVDMTFSSDVQWNYGQNSPASFQYDIESVTVHELGHAHQLGHVIDANDIMHRAIGTGDKNRIIKTGNIKGGNFVQSQSLTKNPCGPSEMKSFAGCTPKVGIEDQQAINSIISIYPNPTSNQLNIAFDRVPKNGIDLSIMDLSGRKLKAVRVFNIVNTIDLGNLPDGMYLIQSTKNGRDSYGKFMVKN